MENILSVRNLTKTFTNKEEEIYAVKDMSFDLYAGECLGLIGESGSGKTTAANLIAGLETPDSGEIRLFGEVLDASKRRKQKVLYSNIQMIFQNPRTSFNPRIRMYHNIAEGAAYYQKLSKSELCENIHEKMRLVGLKDEYLQKYAWQLSGGECQRAAIARAIMSNPKLLICDEVTSALDVSVQAQILKLLGQLKKEYGMSLFFITHDLALAGSFCDRLLVMYKGQIVESGKSMDLISNPKHPYTKLLISSVLSADPRDRKIRNH